MPKGNRRSRGTTTILDVASAAGVSSMTVSRVVNGAANVRQSTRDLVQETIARLNYSPNTAARSLAAGHATHIGLFYANPSDAYLTQFLVGALDGARRAGCHLVLEVCEGETADAQAEATRRFASTDVEGVILPPPISEYEPVHAALAAAGIPVVSVARGRQPADTLNVGIDDHGAAKTITRHLIELGHRHIGLIRGHPEHMASAERQRGFVDALREAGIDPAEAPVEQGFFSYRSGLVAAERLLARRPRPTAIFASNDDMAAAAVSSRTAAGWRCPATSLSSASTIRRWRPPSGPSSPRSASRSRRWPMPRSRCCSPSCMASAAPTVRRSTNGFLISSSSCAIRPGRRDDRFRLT